MIDKASVKPADKLLKGLSEPEALQLISEATARKYIAIPLAINDSGLQVAIADPEDIFALEALASQSQMRIEPEIASAEEIQEAIDFMREHNLRHLPVTDAGELIGVISDRDIKLVLGPDFAYPDPNKLKVKEAMVRESYLVDLNERLDTVLEHMASHHIGSAVVTRNGKLAGVFTTSDACREFADFLREQFRRSGGDDAA